jgi:hypothetical protein
MSDTVPGAIIMASLGSGVPSFLPLPEAAPASDVVHVNGGAYATPGSMALLVEFRTLAPDVPAAVAGPSPMEQPATVSGYVALVPDDQAPNVIAGALQHFP